jgi:hypothetical protein
VEPRFINPFRNLEYVVCNNKFALRNPKTNHIVDLYDTLPAAMQARDKMEGKFIA